MPSSSASRVAEAHQLPLFPAPAVTASAVTRAALQLRRRPGIRAVQAFTRSGRQCLLIEFRGGRTPANIAHVHVALHRLGLVADLLGVVSDGGYEAATLLLSVDPNRQGVSDV